MEVGPVCEEYGIWLHVDAAYAGPSFACMELRHLMQGYEYVWSTNVSASKWMLTNFDACFHWVRYFSKAVDPMVGWEDSVYKGPSPPDLKHYGIASTRRFRAMKVWMVIRNYGVEGLRRYIRNHINLAKLFEMYVRRDTRFEVCGPVRFGVCTFRLKGLNDANTKLLDAMNYSRRIHMVPSHYHDKVVIRFAVVSEKATEKDVDDAWRTIDGFASVTLHEYEKENAGVGAMKALYTKQHRHDEVQSLHKDERATLEETEAHNALQELRAKLSMKKAALVTSVDASAVDGAWDTGNVESFKKFDEYLMSHPELAEDQIFKYEEIKGVQSMLHLKIIEAASGLTSQQPSAPGKQPEDDTASIRQSINPAAIRPSVAAVRPSVASVRPSIRE